MTQTVILAAARKPIGKFDGALAPLSGSELGAITIDEVLKRANVAPGEVVGSRSSWGRC